MDRMRQANSEEDKFTHLGCVIGNCTRTVTGEESESQRRRQRVLLRPEHLLGYLLHHLLPGPISVDEEGNSETIIPLRRIRRVGGWYEIVGDSGRSGNVRTDGRTSRSRTDRYRLKDR